MRKTGEACSESPIQMNFAATEKNNGREIRHDWPKVAQASCLCDEKNRRSLFRIPNPNEFCGHGKKQWPRNPA
jgi:hypothetical protein